MKDRGRPIDPGGLLCLGLLFLRSLHPLGFSLPRIISIHLVDVGETY